MPKTKAQIAKYARGWRKYNCEQKRFNKPLREFMELKYRDIFNEYHWFYKLLDEKHPDSKDLTKTKTFKEWKKRQLNCESSDDEQSESETRQNEVEFSEARRDEAEFSEARPDEVEFSEARPDEVEFSEARPDEVEFSEARPDETEQVETESVVSDILEVAINETLPPITTSTSTTSIILSNR